ncbi:SDR family NAD(P)-dependent oxidoreductase [Gloeocapsopsis crepidinum LEGE 06123]|uniref:SDR family NAD(P)-dependent oxidoreductase n=1 Tax=Gloeocapsopsis crepidinum LEGE 06123 TaxID=588587 RepID=A0ABR9UQJ5_9CHRO|nr:SDR family NAD(P)-dependent oxidoreductase [Gloeocapsopsis crepidinum]MBE9189623.1 SDR family NAD(P)-dependent oxidoreductase [Gloeocapsopsis crepidinum LEGE 06123]
MANKLDGKVALITGASSGIGEASALALAAEGAKVVLAARRLDRLEKLVSQVKDSGKEAIAIQTDITDQAQTTEMLQKANANFGSVDILINNAGVMLTGLVDGADTSDWRRMVDIDLLGLMYATHAALPIMKEQGSGHIINIASVAGRLTFANFAVYNAVKFGVVAFSDALRKEVYQNKIRVTVIEPGAVATELTNHITDQESKQQVEGMYQSLTPLESEDVANAILYAVTQPARVNVNEILIMPTDQVL